MDVTAMVPGLGIRAEEIGDRRDDSLPARLRLAPMISPLKITEKQQPLPIRPPRRRLSLLLIKECRELRPHRWLPPIEPVLLSSANQAQVSANQAAAGTAGAIGVMDAAAISKVNDGYRISPTIPLWRRLGLPMIRTVYPQRCGQSGP